jgi:Arc/MetJ family transcription regulator
MDVVPSRLVNYFKMKVSIDIDERLMRRAKRLTGLRTRAEVVEQGLQTLVRLKEQERIRRHRGRLRFRGDLARADDTGRSVVDFRGSASHPSAAVVIKRTLKDYRKTLRNLASGPRRTKKI